MTHGIQLLQQRQRCHSEMQYMISSRSVADGVSLLLVSMAMSKVVCRILIYIYNKLK